MMTGTCQACARPNRRLRSMRSDAFDGGGLIWACFEDREMCHRLSRADRLRRIRFLDSLDRRYGAI